MCMWVGRLVPISELMMLVHTSRWRLDIYCTEDEKGYLSVTKRFLCDNETDERWELKSFGVHNGEQVAKVISVKKGDRI